MFHPKIFVLRCTLEYSNIITHDYSHPFKCHHRQHWIFMVDKIFYSNYSQKSTKISLILPLVIFMFNFCWNRFISTVYLWFQQTIHILNKAVPCTHHSELSKNSKRFYSMNWLQTQTVNVQCTWNINFYVSIYPFSKNILVENRIMPILEGNDI